MEEDWLEGEREKDHTFIKYAGAALAFSFAIVGRDHRPRAVYEDGEE